MGAAIVNLNPFHQPVDKARKVLRLVRSLRPAPRDPGLSLILLMAYDWPLGIEAIRRAYAIADEVVVGIDAQRRSFSGRPYPFDDKAFRRALAKVDPQRKIRVLEGDFHSLPRPMDNEVLERNTLSLACRPGNWYVQVDSDEWMLNPEAFKAWLMQQRVEREIMSQWITVFKVIGRTALVVDSPAEWHRVACSRRGVYWQGRESGSWRKYSPLKMLHHSWGRTEADVRRKITSWGHARDFDTEAYLRFWRSVNLKNYASFRDLHYLEKTLWPRLIAVPLDDVERLAASRA